MEIRIKLTKQMIATARSVAILEMPEEIDNIDKYLKEDSDEVIDLDISLLDPNVRTQFAAMLGMFVMGQKAQEADK